MRGEDGLKRIPTYECRFFRKFDLFCRLNSVRIEKKNSEHFQKMSN
jgi:hypothetical protein